MNDPNVIYFIMWVVGMFAVGGTTFLISRSIRIVDDNDTNAIRVIAYWGVFLEVIWAICGLMILTS